MSRWPNKYVIGLTGNIAVGKSVVRKMLQHLGAYTIDADGLAHQAMSPGAPAYKPVVNTFGKFILDSDGRINRSKLGSIVFADAEALAKLEKITHPIVRKAIDTLISRAKQRVVVIEAIKLLEGDLAGAVDTVWVVDSSEDVQLKRLMEKRNFPEALARQRISAQNPQAEKLQKANVVIKNNGDVEDTWKQVQMHWGDIRKALTSGQAPPKSAPAPKAETEAAPRQEAAAPPQPEPQPEPEPIPEPEAEKVVVDASGMVVKRGMPGNAQQIAEFISTVSGNDTSRMDVMMSFGQKSYLLADSGDEQVLGLLGWTVENLVTRMDEFYIAAGAPVNTVVQAIVHAVEEASKELQSEVGFIFLPKATDDQIILAFQEHDYQPITLPEIKIPAWREAVEETIDGQETVVLWKQLRKDRVLQPI